MLSGTSLRTAICGYTKNSDAESRQNEGCAHDHYLVGTTVPERLRGGARWRIRTGARRKSSEQRR